MNRRRRQEIEAQKRQPTSVVAAVHIGMERWVEFRCRQPLIVGWSPNWLNWRTMRSPPFGSAFHLLNGAIQLADRQFHPDRVDRVPSSRTHRGCLLHSHPDRNEAGVVLSCKNSMTRETRAYDQPLRVCLRLISKTRTTTKCPSCPLDNYHILKLTKGCKIV